MGQTFPGDINNLKNSERNTFHKDQTSKSCNGRQVN